MTPISEKLDSWKLAAAVAGAVVGSTVFAILGLIFRRCRHQRTRRLAFSAISKDDFIKGPVEILGAVRPNSLLHRTTVRDIRHDMPKRKEVS